jgi:hypothetical protein
MIVLLEKDVGIAYNCGHSTVTIRACKGRQRAGLCRYLFTLADGDV